ncbi:MAG: sigma-70 family RNA polymerase sigma factor [Gemmatimonadaceae bacterium]
MVAEPEPESPSDAESSASDGALATRVQRGDAAAFDELVRRYMGRAFAVAYRVLGHREDAEDLVQDAFVAALANIERFDVARPFGPWLFRIIVNRGLNARKARAVRRTEAVPPGASAPGASPQGEAERAEIRDRFEVALAALPERQRVIVRLFELEGFSSLEIAGMLDLSDGTVRWHLHRARRALREALAPLHGDDDDE